MTPDAFRRIALSMPQASEGAHMGHPDFRVGGKILATLGYPDERFGVVMLPPEEQEKLLRSYPKRFHLRQARGDAAGAQTCGWMR